MIILIDQDGPLANLEQAILDEYKRRFPGEFFVPLEARKNSYVRLDYPKEIRYRIDDIQYSREFYSNLQPTLGCVAALHEMISPGHDPRICSAPSNMYESCVREKYAWVEQYLGREFTSRIILTKDKTLVRGHVLIDDRSSIHGTLTPEWEHVIYDLPFNQHIVDKKRLTWKNWKQVLGLQTVLP